MAGLPGPHEPPTLASAGTLAERGLDLPGDAVAGSPPRRAWLKHSPVTGTGVLRRPDLDVGGSSRIVSAPLSRTGPGFSDCCERQSRGSFAESPVRDLVGDRFLRFPDLVHKRPASTAARIGPPALHSPRDVVPARGSDVGVCRVQPSNERRLLLGGQALQLDRASISSNASKRSSGTCRVTASLSLQRTARCTTTPVAR